MKLHKMERCVWSVIMISGTFIQKKVKVKEKAKSTYFHIFYSWMWAPSTMSTVSLRLCGLFWFLVICTVVLVWKLSLVLSLKFLVPVCYWLAGVWARPLPFRTLLLEEMAAAVWPRWPLCRGQRLPKGQPAGFGSWRRATGESEWIKND